MKVGYKLAIVLIPFGIFGFILGWIDLPGGKIIGVVVGLVVAWFAVPWWYGKGW